MALNSTMYRFSIKISDITRGVYESIELRVPMHPSESVPFLLTRVIAYCLNFQEGLTFSQGISSPDEPALQVKDLTGLIELWIDIGNPSSKRLHKASKSSKKVLVYTHRDPAILLKDLAETEIHRSEFIEVFSLRPDFLSALGATLDRDNRWELLHNEGELSITSGPSTVQGELKPHRL
jgi:uncharacterized protein YaeQ